MATFMADYLCESCGEVSEVLTHNEDYIVGCPHCGSIKMVQVLGGYSTKLHDKEILKETLKKRSADHSLREVKKQAGWKTGALPKDFGRARQK
jgi:DNA-directed RNA polymerase subunit RPC12/RpoP